MIIAAGDEVEVAALRVEGSWDYYFPKPFEIHFRLVRLRAAIRLKGGFAGPELTNGAMSIDPLTHDVRNGAVGSIRLSNRELSLLRVQRASRNGSIAARTSGVHLRWGKGSLE